ncbi:MAG: MarR family transcriptional regulator [Propionibacteriaceae bacterium]|nr:MarR family transcriptional regulator [Propionibacteriaceae bacterium]
MDPRSETEQRLALQLHRWVAASGQLAHRYAVETELTPTDFKAILHLWEEGLEGRAVTASQLAAHLGVTPAAVTYLVERLMKRGYVQRTPNPADRRQVLLSLSVDGGQLGHGFLRPQASWLNAALSAHSDEAIAHTIDVLTDLTAALTNHALRKEHHD